MNDPSRSYILLAPPSQSQGFDRLFLREVNELPLKGVDLVTVSACETNAGKLIRGEGVQSFSRAFLAAGARSVVTSLWAVGDRATADLMLQFYSRLTQGQFKADALRSAKLEVLHRPESAHPSHWAAFVLNGESLASLPYIVSWTWIASPLALLAGAILFFRMRGRKA
jgi:CHAT domain-containing protein